MSGLLFQEILVITRLSCRIGQISEMQLLSFVTRKKCVISVLINATLLNAPSGY